MGILLCLFFFGVDVGLQGWPQDLGLFGQEHTMVVSIVIIGLTDFFFRRFAVLRAVGWPLQAYD
jgi:hypothetical protein